MKKFLILSIFVCLSAISVFGQDIVSTKDFSGDWELDVSKSKLDERARVESMTMTVAQTNDDIKIETSVKRAEASRDGGGMNRGGGMAGGGNSNLTYTLNGKETRTTQDSPMGAIPVTLKANLQGDILKLTQTRTINTQMGEITMITKEIWSLSADGKTLTVKRETQTPRGTNSSELVFAKATYLRTTAVDRDSNNPSERVAVQTNTGKTSPTLKTVSGGVVNGKARNLAVPKYPDGARAARASGQVAVAVTIDEEGKVISASAVSGHPLLRAAAEEAARASIFNPTTFEGRPVKVTGTIIYNFVP